MVLISLLPPLSWMLLHLCKQKQNGTGQSYFISEFWQTFKLVFLCIIMCCLVFDKARTLDKFLIMHATPYQQRVQQMLLLKISSSYLVVYCKDLPVCFMSPACIGNLPSLCGKYIFIVICMYYRYNFFSNYEICVYIHKYISLYISIFPTKYISKSPDNLKENSPLCYFTLPL